MNDSLRSRLTHAGLVLFIYTILYVIFFAPVLLAGKVLAPCDGTNLALPHLYAPRVLWTTLLFAGFPVMGDPQTMASYPPALVCSLWAGSFNVFVLSAYVLASSFTYGYVRALTGSRLAALAAGVIYGMGGFFMAHLGHTNVIHSAAWMPLLLWALERLRHRASPGWVVVAAVAVACSTLAGHPQFGFYTLLVGFAYVAVLAWGAPAGGYRFSGCGLAGMVLGLGLAALLLVPTAELAGQSYRARMTFADFAGYSLPIKQLPMLLFPYLYGGGGNFSGPDPLFFGRGGGLTEATGYVGLLPLVLAGLGFAFRRREGVARFWLVVAVLSVLAALGKESPLVRLLYHVPVYNKFRILTRHAVHCSLAVAVLSGFGLAGLARLGRAERLRALRRGAAVLATVCGLMLVLFWGLGRAGAYAHPFDPAAVPVLSVVPWHNPAVGIPLVLLIVGLGAAGLWAWYPAAPTKALLVVALVLDVGYFGWCYNCRGFGGVDADVIAMPDGLRPYREELTRTGQRLLPLSGDGPKEMAPPNRSRLWGLPSALGYAPLVLKRYTELTDCHYIGFDSYAALDPASRVFDVLAVRYLLLPRTYLNPALAKAAPLLTAGDRWRHCADLGTVAIYENPRALPRAWLTAEAVCLSPDQVRQTIRQGRLPDGRLFDPRRTALVEEPVSFAGGGSEGRVEVIEAADGRVEVVAESAAPAFLVLSDTWYPGWQVEVNGRPATIARTNYVLRGVLLPGGRSRVVFTFRPQSFHLGVGITGLSVLVVLGLLVWGMRSKARNTVKAEDAGGEVSDGESDGNYGEKSGILVTLAGDSAYTR